jgi:hypothetical protein
MAWLRGGDKGAAMENISLRKQMLSVLTRTDLQTETIVSAAELLAADGRFNMWIATKKRKKESLNFTSLLEFYETLGDECAQGLDEFRIRQDQLRLQDWMNSARAELDVRSSVG